MRDYQIDSLLAAITAVAVLTACGWVLLSLLRRRMAERHEIRLAVLAKLSSEEMVRLLESDGGRAWLRDVLAGADDLRTGIERATTVVLAGIGSGVAGMVLHLKVAGVLGMIFVAVGAGQLVAVFLLSRRAPKAGDGR